MLIQTPNRILLAVALCAMAFAPSVVRAAEDPLPSLNDGKSKQAIVAFVEKVTREGSADFVPVEYTHPTERKTLFEKGTP